MKHKFRLLIVDDHPVFRRGLREIIEENPKFQVVGEASDGKTSLQLAKELGPDIVVMDIDMPGLNGLGVARELSAQKIDTHVVFMTFHVDEDLMRAAMGSSRCPGAFSSWTSPY